MTFTDLHLSLEPVSQLLVDNIMKKLQVYARRRKPDGHLEHTTKIIQGQGLEPGHSTTES